MSKKIIQLNFRPLTGLTHSHLQIVTATFFPIGAPPPSVSYLVELGNSDQLSCEVSIPPDWNPQKKTIALVHGLGGSHASPYMIRMARKLYDRGFKVVRVNLRGCGTGHGLSQKPYNGGNSHDLLNVLKALKKDAPTSKIDVVGFSIGGNIVIKLAGELGALAGNFVNAFFAVCAPLNLAKSVQLIEKKNHRLYLSFFLKRINQQAKSWSQKDFQSISEFDENITAPLWGYHGAQDYYQKCSGLNFLPLIKHPLHMVFAEDDPFVPMEALKGQKWPHHVNVYTTPKGGHMGFIGPTPTPFNFYWMDHLLLNWFAGDFNSNLKR